MTYVSDSISGVTAEKDNAKAKEEGGRLEFHNANLFDMDEDLYGNLVDEATGLRIDNSTDNGLGLLAVREVNRNGRSTDALGDVPRSRADKMADEWLKQNGLDWNE